MKKLKYLLLALPLFAFTSCDDDGKDIPDVTLTTEIYGYYYVEGQSTRYVLPDDELVFGSVSVTDNNGKNSAVTGVIYSINGMGYFAANLQPFSCVIPTNMLLEGNNIITLDMTVAVVGYPVTSLVGEYTFVGVNDASQLPEGAVYVPAPSTDSGSGSDSSQTE